jgi:hypothetical protein
MAAVLPVAQDQSERGAASTEKLIAKNAAPRRLLHIFCARYSRERKNRNFSYVEKENRC